MSNPLPQTAPSQHARRAAEKNGSEASGGGSGTPMNLYQRSDLPHRPSLAGMHQRTVAVELALGGRPQILVGRGVYERDPELGGILRIELPADAGCEFVLVENSWDGEVQPGEAHGCDFLVRII